MSTRSTGGDSAVVRRRSYRTPVRDRKAAETRYRIMDAGSELVHGFASWDWKELTFRAVAERAGVGERTVYRHFPTERHLHDAVMQRLEEEAGITYEAVTLENLNEVTARIFATRQSFAAPSSVTQPDDPTFVVVDEQRRNALTAAVAMATPEWSDEQRQPVSAALDVLWNLPSYERLVGVWNLDREDATRIITWLMAKVVEAIRSNDPSLVPSAGLGGETVGPFS